MSGSVVAVTITGTNTAGTALNSAGASYTLRPLPGATVSVTSLNGYSAQVIADNSGNFQLLTQPGVYTVTAHLPPGSTLNAQCTPRSVAVTSGTLSHIVLEFVPQQAPPIATGT